jgi:hypothetical protein
LSYKVAHYNRSAIKDVIVDFLEECNVPYLIVPFDDALFNACLERAAQKGYPVATESVGTGFVKALKVGVAITRTSYGHLPDYDSLIWMALWTAFVTYADDAFQDDIHHLQSFARTFMQNERHEHPVLEAFASFLRECSITFPHFVANTVISSALRFMMSIALEFEGQTSKVSFIYRGTCQSVTKSPGPGFQRGSRLSPIHPSALRPLRCLHFVRVPKDPPDLNLHPGM